MNYFLLFFAEFYVPLCQKGKITAEESPEQYPEVQNFVISAVLLLEFASTPHIQIASTPSCNSPPHMGAQVPDVLSLAQLSPHHLLLSWLKQLGRPGPVLVMSQSIHRVFMLHQITL